MRRSPELFLGSKKKKKKKKTLGDVRKDRFKAFGGGAAAKKGQGKEKAPMFTEKKKVSGKSDGEVKPIRGMVLCGPLGRGRSPSQTSGEKATRSLTLRPRIPPPPWPQPSPGKAPSGPLSVCLCAGIALIHCLPARMEFTFLLAELRCLHTPTPPQALLQKPRRVWLGGGESSFVRCLDKGAPAFPKPHRCEELVTLVFVQPY